MVTMEAIDILFVFIMLASAVVAVFYRIYCESLSGKKVLAQHVPINNCLINLDPSMNVLNVEAIVQTSLLQPSTFHVELRKGVSILWQKEIKAYSESSLNLRVP